MPVDCGSTTPCTAAAQTAASMALPPARSMSIAARVASGCEVAAIASVARTGERPGNWKSRILSGYPLVTSANWSHLRIGRPNSMPPAEDLRNRQKRDREHDQAGRDGGDRRVDLVAQRI